MESERSIIERAMAGVYLTICGRCEGAGEIGLPSLRATCPVCGGCGLTVTNQPKVERMPESTRKFTVEIRDYESGAVPDQLGTTRVENAVADMLDEDGSDGTVIVEEVTE